MMAVNLGTRGIDAARNLVNIATIRAERIGAIFEKSTDSRTASNQSMVFKE